MENVLQDRSSEKDCSLSENEPLMSEHVSALQFLLSGNRGMNVDERHSRLSPAGSECCVRRGELMCTAILVEDHTATLRTTCLDTSLIEEYATYHDKQTSGYTQETKAVYAEGIPSCVSEVGGLRFLRNRTIAPAATAMSTARVMYA
jgi:hypothetical protein